MIEEQIWITISFVKMEGFHSLKSLIEKEDTYARYCKKKIEKETVQMIKQIEIWRYLMTSLSCSCAAACFFC